MTKSWMSVQPPKKTADFRPGDTVRVFLKVAEGEGERTQAFEGTVIKKRGSGPSETFTVRKISFGVGVERTFPLQSPRIEKIVSVRGGRARRATLYYVRERIGKAAKLQEESREAGSPEPEGLPPPNSGPVDSKSPSPPLEKAPVKTP